MTDRRLRVAIGLLSLAGAGIAAYLTAAHFADATLLCATGGCETVQRSRYAELAGVPVAALGLAGYVAIAATAASRGELWRAAGFVFALGGLAFAGYLVWVQVGVLHALCQWCLGSDAILALLVPATLLRLRAGGLAASCVRRSAGRMSLPPSSSSVGTRSRATRSTRSASSLNGLRILFPFRSALPRGPGWTPRSRSA